MYIDAGLCLFLPKFLEYNILLDFLEDGKCLAGFVLYNVGFKEANSLLIKDSLDSLGTLLYDFFDSEVRIRLACKGVILVGLLV